jgi:hypothetical protein
MPPDTGHLLVVGPLARADSAFHTKRLLIQMLKTIPDGRDEDAEQRVDTLLDALSVDVVEAVNTTVENGGNASIHARVSGSRVVLDYSDTLGRDATVEFDRYKQSDGEVTDLTVELRP